MAVVRVPILEYVQGIERIERLERDNDRLIKALESIHDTIGPLERRVTGFPLWTIRKARSTALKAIYGWGA